ncbi:MAG TPA: hypothetical protein VGY48_10415 [Vicinamibacterales bacterium]|jgi:hypothetical protein|nr:hypothetical protein [Vicinamibacterales bacterium]
MQFAWRFIFGLPLVLIATTRNHLDDALDLKYLTAEQHTELFKLADRAIGATTRLHQYLKGRKDSPADPAPGTGTENPSPEPRTKNEPEPLNPEL